MSRGGLMLICALVLGACAQRDEAPASGGGRHAKLVERAPLDAPPPAPAPMVAAASAPPLAGFDAPFEPEIVDLKLRDDDAEADKVVSKVRAKRALSAVNGPTDARLAQGMGFRGTGSGGGGSAVGRLSGLGRIDTGGAKARGPGLAWGTRGVALLGVSPGSQLGRLGLRSADTVLAVDGTPVQALPGLLSTLAATDRPPTLEVVRQGRRVVLYPDAEVGEANTEKPAQFLPRMFYFQNTYLGRSPAYLEQLRRLDAVYGLGARPYAEATLPAQALDAPTDAGLSLTATLDRASLEAPGRVFLQVGLQGSRRFGWRRPPVDLALVVDAAVAGGAPETFTKAVTGLLRRLGPQDRLGVVVVDPAGPRVLTEVADLRTARTRLTRSLVDFAGQPTSEPTAVGEALVAAGGLLRAAAEGQARVPGTQTVLFLTQGDDLRRVSAAEAAAHQLTVQGAVTSVIDLAGGNAWWRVANAGHGNDHRGRDLDAALDAELARLSRVIARLLRVNIRLGAKTHAIRVLGSRVLEQAEVARVKAREEATDRQLSKTMGVQADRGDDDDGVQTVIPYFLGGDAHVILVELWVDEPGAVAEVTLKYKDMVSLDNATARASVSLAGLPRPRTAAHREVRRNVQGFELAETLAEAARHLERGAPDQAQVALAGARPVSDADRAVLTGFTHLLTQPRGPHLARALRLASRRRISHTTAR